MEPIEARKQGEGWRRVSANYLRGYCLHTEDFQRSLGRIEDGDTVTIKGQEFRLPKLDH